MNRLSARWRGVGVGTVVLALAFGAGSAVLAQAPSGAPVAPPTLAPVRTSTLFNPQQAPATPTPSVPTVSAVTQPVLPGPPVPLATGTPAGVVSLTPTTVAQTPTPAGLLPLTGAVTATATPRPGTTVTPIPLLTPTPAPRPSLMSEGIELVGAFAADIDGMITPADEFQFVALVRAPGVDKLTMRLSGAPFLRASKEFTLMPGDNWLQIADFKVDTEQEPVIREEVIRKVGGTIPIRDGALVMAMDFTDRAGNQRTATFEPVVYEFNAPEKVAKIEYPDVKRITGMPPRDEAVQKYYLRGDADFHHPEDFAVRKLAIEAGRRGGVFPDDPETVADNIFRFINSTFGDADPGDFNNDYNIARLIDEGSIVRGRINGGYICIAQTYLMTALTRTLGLPSRELNLAVGKPNWQGNDGMWRVTWWQEGAAHVWYNGQWNLYDLWIGFKGIEGYWEKNMAYQMWAAYDQRTAMFTTTGGVNTGLRGHDFNAWPGEPPQWEFVREGAKPGVRVLDIPGDAGAPITYVPDFGLGYLSPDAVVEPSGPAYTVAAPPAMGIAALPEMRP